MKAKALLAACVVLAVILAGESWAVVEDPTYILDGELLVKYGKLEKPEQYEYISQELRGELGEWLYDTLTKKPENELTVEEAYWLMMANYGDIPKMEHYFNLIMQKDPTYVPAYLHLGNAYAIRGSSTNNPKLYAKGIELTLKTLEYNPDGIIVRKEVGKDFKIKTVTEPDIWRGVGSALLVLGDTYGYDIPHDLAMWFYNVGESGLYRNLSSREDLERIGFYERRDQVLQILNKPPLAQRIIQALPISSEKKGYIGEFFARYPLAGGVVLGVFLGVAIFMLWTVAEKIRERVAY